MLKNLSIILLISSFIITSCKDRGTTNADNQDINSVPTNLTEAINYYDEVLNDSLKMQYKKLSEDEYMTELHFGSGAGIRNGWDLWKGSKLSEFFNNLGIHHPDDMSAIIMRSYHRKLNGKDIRLQEQIKHYQEYWAKVEITRLPEKSEHPEPNLEFRVAIFYGFHTSKNRPAQVFIQTNSKTNTFWIYDYYYGWKNIDLQTKEKLEKDRIQNAESNLNEIFGREITLPNKT